MAKYMIFRNDDVRQTLDDTLIELTDIFINNEIPLTLAVEPANITKEVVEWLLKIKKQYPNLIEIMQHGYEHKIKSGLKKGEFGGNRTYEEQYNEIKKGKEIMDAYFGNLWFHAINFPYGVYNPATIKAVNDVGYKVINSHYNSKPSRKIFYKVGHLLNKGYLFDKHISWNLDFYPNTNLFEIDANISFISKYIDEGTTCTMFTLEELIEKTKTYMHNKVISILFHHRYHNTKDKMNLIKDYIEWTKQQNFQYLTSEQVYNKFSGKNN